MKQHQAAFTLIELLVSLAISVIILGGVIATFARMNDGIRNASRASDLTNSMRGAFTLFQKELFASAKGFGDLNSYQIHYSHPDAADEDYFYSIANLDDSGTGSEIVLQWFDYEFSDRQANPTFVAMTESGLSVPGGFGIGLPPMIFASTVDVDPALLAVAMGDVFIVYCGDALYDTTWYDLRDGTDSSSFLVDETAIPIGAGIVSVAQISNLGPAGDFKTRILVDFAASGPFANGFNVPISTPYIQPAQEPSAYLNSATTKPADSGKVRFPPSTWFARKVGNLQGFHRVEYSIDHTTLLRTENGLQMILSTEVEDFNILIGLDEVDLTRDWDGAVSSLEPAFWVSNYNSFPSVGAGREAVGKHALAAIVELKKSSLFKDTSNADTDNAGSEKKTRYFKQQYRLKNMHLPLGNY
jgi:prepilin-type N-terminal cleavage/methylation domain-containing protein